MRKEKERTKKYGVLLKRSTLFLLIFQILLLSVFLPYSSVLVTAATEKRLTGFTTYFNGNDRGRCANIKLAASYIDGIRIQPYGDFSFNAVVGKRTKERGFQTAKVILDGEYVEGVGGGVCQVSTTLYNAALLSGMTVTEYHPHSLAVGYVSPSRDAMVSSVSDLKLFNPFEFTLRLETKVGENWISVAVYGGNNGDSYQIVSRALEELLPPEPLIKEGEDEKILRAEKNGVKSEAYLETYRYGQLIERKRIRKDRYAPIQGIIVKKIDNPTKKMP